MDDSTTIAPNRRRRALVWGLFGLTGIIMGSVYAAGYSSSDSGVATGASPDVFGDAVSEETRSPYAGLLSSPEALTVGFQGDWGLVAQDTTVFRVDLTGESAGTYYVDILVNNVPDGWSSLQFKWVQAPCDADPADTDFTTGYATAASAAAGDPKLMAVTTQDAHVSFPGLAFGAEYCFGIAAIPQADDQPEGTVLVRETGTTPNAPDFMAIVNRSA